MNLPPYIERLALDRYATDRRPPPPDADFQQLYPLLFELLTTEIREGTRTHDPATLTLTGGRAEWVVRVSVGYLAQGCACSGESLPAALERMEKALADGTARWTPWRDKGPKLKLPDGKPGPQANGAAPGKRKRKPG